MRNSIAALAAAGTAVVASRSARRSVQRQAARADAKRKSGTRVPVIGHVERARVSVHNAAADVCLVRDYLAGIGCAPEFIARYEGVFGKKVAEVYRARTGLEPARHGRVVARGRIFDVMSYEDETDMETAARAWHRTADRFPVAAPEVAPVVEADPLADCPVRVDDRVRLFVSDCPDPVSGTVTEVYVNVIGRVVATVEFAWQSPDWTANVEHLTVVGGGR